MSLRSTLVAMFAALCMGVVACGDSEDDAAGGGDAATAAEETASADASKCGLGNGKKATGDPIKLAGLATKQPGVDFTQITAMAKAYFDCVNDNGGIDGRPVDYIAKTEQTNPQQVASLVTKLWENDKVLGFVGNTSLLDCAVNQKFYEERDILQRNLKLGVRREETGAVARTEFDVLDHEPVGSVNDVVAAMEAVATVYVSPGTSSAWSSATCVSAFDSASRSLETTVSSYSERSRSLCTRPLIAIT